MIFRQLFHASSCTYSYLIGCKQTRQALIIDPVFEKTESYLRLIKELDLKLIKAADTHCHADHMTGLGELRNKTQCITVMGDHTAVDVVSMRVQDGDKIAVGNIELTTIYTPGHTDDSYCYSLPDRVFTGDTLFIRGTGRTDFQHGDPVSAYNSIMDKLLILPDETLIFPGHDYKGETVSTIGEERAFNPRLQVSSAAQYADIMNNLNLPNPKLMDTVIPANLQIGYSQENQNNKDKTISTDEASARLGRHETIFVDLREDAERERDGTIPGSIHVPYDELPRHIKSGGMLRTLASETGKTLILYCAFGERSALALARMTEMDIHKTLHMAGGIKAWKAENLPLE